MLHKSIDLANANVFMQKLQPFAYSGYVPGRLPTKDGSAQLIGDVWYRKISFSITKSCLFHY